MTYIHVDMCTLSTFSFNLKILSNITILKKHFTLLQSIRFIKNSALILVKMAE